MSLGVSFCVFSCLFASFRVFSHFSILRREKTRKDTNNTLDLDLFVSIRIVLCLLGCLFASFRVSFRVFSSFSMTGFRCAIYNWCRLIFFEVLCLLSSSFPL